MGADSDILICGSCRQDFLLDNLSAFMAHKKFDCDINDQTQLALLCHSCEENFTSPWQLIQHAQQVHAIKLYQDNRLIKQPDKTATFTAAQSYVHAAFEDSHNGVVAEYNPQKCQDYGVNPSKHRDEQNPKVESRHQSGSPLRERNASDNQATKTDAATQVDDPLTEEKKASEDDRNYCCCSNQNCGVTVMPGTHERLKECCNAVIPKKRKRHMETKHIPMTLLRKKKVFEGTKVVRTDMGMGDIYIDVETSGPNDSTNEHKSRLPEPKAAKSPSGSTQSRDLSQRALPGSKQRSVIIQPGTTFSIPVSYAVVQQPLLHTRNRNVNVVDKPHTLTRPITSSSSEISDSPVILVDSSRIIPIKPTSEPADRLGNNSINQVSVPPTTLPFSVQQTKPVTSNQMTLVGDQTHSVPLIASQLFGRPQGVVASGITLNDADKEATATAIDPTRILSLVMSVNQDGTKNIEVPPGGSDSTFESDLVIDHTDQMELNTKPTDVASISNDIQAPADSLSQDSPTTCDAKIEGTMSDGDASQSGDSRSMKKRRYPTSRPFKCDQCSQAFNQRIHLRKHQSKHTGIKPFKCGQCDYSTVERSHLKVHIRVHTGEKPYKCTYCEYATAQNSTLKIHLKRHHDGEGSSRLMCRTCGKKFKQLENLEVHYRQHSSADEH